MEFQKHGEPADYNTVKPATEPNPTCEPSKDVLWDRHLFLTPKKQPEVWETTFYCQCGQVTAEITLEDWASFGARLPWED